MALLLGDPGGKDCRASERSRVVREEDRDALLEAVPARVVERAEAGSVTNARVNPVSEEHLG